MNAAPRDDPQPGGSDLWVIGNVLIDLMMMGVAEIPPWGTEVLATGRSEQIGGQGANLARAAARLGLSTMIGSVVGDDPSGRDIRGALEAGGVNVGALKVVPGQTALAIAAVRPDGERAFITDLGCSAAFGIDDLAEWVPAICGSRAIALVGTSNLPGVDLSVAAGLLREARSRGVITIFDPGWGPEIVESGPGIDELLRSSGIFLPNRDEAEALTGERDIGAILRSLRERCGDMVIVTCGEAGSVTLDGDTAVLVEALPLEVDNAVGAGDIFAAAVISGLLDDPDPISAMVRGTAAVASYISRSQDRYAAVDAWRDHASSVKIRRL